MSKTHKRKVLRFIFGTLKLVTGFKYSKLKPHHLEVGGEGQAPGPTLPPPDSATGELQVYIASHLL